jgi:hypothetical protein
VNSGGEGSFESRYTVLNPGRGGTSREFGYRNSSAKARITRAVTNRQSTAIVMTIRIQDDFSSTRLTSFALTRPAGRSSGLRTDGPFFRADLAAAPTLAKKVLNPYLESCPA